MKTTPIRQATIKQMAECNSANAQMLHIAILTSEQYTSSTTYTGFICSWNTITDENGNLLQELSFDAWGNRRDPATWRAFTGIAPEPLFDRGFTGHEHLYAFALINMNGRMYDPVLGRMLSPDPYMQAPDFSQSFNRYSYCFNNPLVYTDPSGNIQSPLGVIVFAEALTVNLLQGNAHPFNNAVELANYAESFYSQPITIFKSDNINLSVRVNIFTLGINLDATYQKGDVTGTISGGFGFLSGPSFGGRVTYSSNGNSVSIGGGYSSGGFNGSDFSGWYLGGGGSVKLPGDMGYLSLYGTQYFGEKPNFVWQAGYSDGFFSISVNEDFLITDKHRTGGFDMGFGDFHFGALVYTNDPEGEKFDRDKVSLEDEPALLVGKHIKGSKYKKWENGRVIFAPAYIGFQKGNTISRYGISSKYVQTIFQNGIHKFDMQNYYSDYTELEKNPFFYHLFEFNNIFSIYQ